MQKKNLKSLILGLLFISPWLIGFIVFTVIPNSSILLLFVYGFSITTKPKFIGFGNFSRMFSDELFWKSLINTLVYVIGLVPLGLFIALGIALLLNKKYLEVSHFLEPRSIFHRSFQLSHFRQ